MTEYRFVGKGVQERIEQLDPDTKETVLDEFEEHLRVDPENREGDLDSPILPYKDPTYGHTYSIPLADGRFLLKYMVYQDYPIVWLRVLADYETGETAG